jgi:type VI protein secretion system component Hcp
MFSGKAKEVVMNNRYHQPAAMVLLILLISVAPGYCATDGFLTVPDIPELKGESTNVNCLACIELVSVTEGQTAGNSSVIVTKFIDRSSIGWRLLSVSGEAVPEVAIQMFRSGESPVKFWEMVLTEVTVESITMEMAPGDTPPVEQLELTPTHVTWTYVPQKPDGSPDAPVTGTFEYPAGNQAQANGE